MKKENFGNILLVSLLVILVSIAGVSTSFSQTNSCVSASCHSALEKSKYLHPPVKDGCSTCHQVTQEPASKKTKHPGNLTITLTQTGSDLCYMCHEPKNTKKTVHAPIMGKDCTSCHNPHGSPNKGMLKDAVPNLCFQCHPDSMMKQKNMHPPVAAGDCSGCHDNHQSDFPNRLVAEGNKLCFTCHPDKEDGLKTKKSSHLPVRQACIQCHNPHGSANKAMMSAPVPALCAKCHPNETSMIEKAAIKHGPMIDAKTCMNCHEPHYADNERLLQAPQMDLCLRCHNKQLETERGRILDMKSWIVANSNSHGPLKDKDCVSCHNPHGSDYWRSLSRYYPADFYTSYSDGKYALCFSCHDKAAFVEPRTDQATAFRNGRKNLHYVHVNKAAKGRTCRACHEVHADGGSPHHIRQNVGFNGWLMPMNYSPNKTGGSCAPGCHEEKIYSH